MNHEWSSSEAQWVRDGSLLFQQALSGLRNTELTSHSNLIGWTRAHVIAHVAANAQAIGRLLHWASTGEPTPMYASVEERDREIAEGSLMDPDDLRDWWKVSDTSLQTSFADLLPEAWKSKVVTAQGREVTARETLWMRSREVCVHAVDLDAGVGFGDLPEAFLVRLIDDATAKHSSNEQNPSVIINDEQGRSWNILAGSGQFEVHGSTDALASWITGRSAQGVQAIQDSRPPTLAKWL